MERDGPFVRLEDIKGNLNLINEIDWDMTPEEAVRLYLEWGNNWAGGTYVIRSKKDVSLYFVVNTWEDNPKVFLIRRNSQGAEELAEIELPPDVKNRFLSSIGHTKGVHAVSDEIKKWLKDRIYGSSPDGG